MFWFREIKGPEKEPEAVFDILQTGGLRLNKIEPLKN
jgi:hypothetical protein